MAGKAREEHPDDGAPEQGVPAGATPGEAGPEPEPGTEPEPGAAAEALGTVPEPGDATAERRTTSDGPAAVDEDGEHVAAPGTTGGTVDDFAAAMEFHPADGVEAAEPGIPAAGTHTTRFPAAESGSASSRPTPEAGGDGPAAEAPEEPAPKQAEQAGDLTASRLLALPQRPPVGGWRRWLYKATLGRVNVGDSDAVRLARQTEHRIKAPLEGGTRFVTVLSRKGGVGKTTVTTLLGMALADVREDRVIALDANPDRGTLSDRSPGGTRYTARHLVQNRFMIDSFSKFAQYSAREGSRLHVLASDTDPNVAQAFDDADYRAVTDLASKFYSIVLTDSGTGMVHSVMKGSLEKSDVVVLVSGGSVDEARLASETLSWLEAHGRTDLAEKAIVVINQSAGLSRGVNVDEIEAHFASRVEHVVRLPFDPHLAEGSQVDIERLKPATRDAVMDLASLVVDQLRG
ncbi:hypothetical protein [Zhihengliuella sp.]|uniref:nucleotide-binding protein n=1 Tax=Zhihengliuella sp. TaxID=1954483 RepID=UPI0028116E55|nr:hypothetical protein [Zhihengliuella sp.]